MNRAAEQEMRRKLETEWQERKAAYDLKFLLRFSTAREYIEYCLVYDKERK